MSEIEPKSFKDAMTDERWRKAVGYEYGALEENKYIYDRRLANWKSLGFKMSSDWFLLPEVLLHIISQKLEDFIDVVHARSVCSSWRSSFPFPSCLLRTRYSLPAFADYPFKSKDLCTLEKVPLSLLRVKSPTYASKYMLGGLVRDDHMKFPSASQCSVKVKIPGSYPSLVSLHDCEILPMWQHQYRMVGWDPKECNTYYRGVACLPLNKEGGGGEEFVVLVNYFKVLLVLSSTEMRWKRLMNIPDYPCTDLVTFRGRFYAVFFTGKIVSIDPYSLEVKNLMPSSPYKTLDYLIPSGDDELFLVEATSRVSKLDEEAGRWVEITDLGDHVLVIGQLASVSCSVKKLPDGCGVTAKSILFTNRPSNTTETSISLYPH
ncbi:PREDICTED: F-box/kelch-repeat protein At1g64840-like [Camelina sativa]|uniref:F-box/kelch-repeat protein At1g64840-like n=1 Tax=Camelina sativa TaxID=90675 RepID=A0ABM0TPU3_CAMSA|nr:PREDICTED: F-box/kelch-repeat protein At1g64840-like [Camelina sativa]